MKKPRILVVDDSIAIVSSLSAILSVSGYEVSSAYNGSEALRKVHDEEFHLVICDIEMPGITGLEFLSRIRKDYEQDLDVILMTGYLDHDYFIEAIRLGASDFIRKPIDSKQIIRSIQSLQERKKQHNSFRDFFMHVENSEFNFTIDPKGFTQFAISKMVNSFLRQNVQATHNVLNEIMICVDEMVYNAFIHGTLGLSVSERLMDHQEQQKLISELLLRPEIASRRIHFSFLINYANRSIRISVEDDGSGFDHESWMLRVQKEPKLNLDEHGRGISMLYHLAESIEFSKGGRKVAIEKKLDRSHGL